MRFRKATEFCLGVRASKGKGPHRGEATLKRVKGLMEQTMDTYTKRGQEREGRIELLLAVIDGSGEIFGFGKPRRCEMVGVGKRPERDLLNDLEGTQRRG